MQRLKAAQGPRFTSGSKRGIEENVFSRYRDSTMTLISKDMQVHATKPAVQWCDCQGRTFGEVIQLQGDHRQAVRDFLVDMEICQASQLIIHGELFIYFCRRVVSFSMLHANVFFLFCKQVIEWVQKKNFLSGQDCCCFSGRYRRCLWSWDGPCHWQCYRSRSRASRSNFPYSRMVWVVMVIYSDGY